MEGKLIQKQDILDKYNTIDFDSTNKEFLERTIIKILRCQNLLSLNYEPSKRKGYHIRIHCNIECEICRLVFDDSTRYSFDAYREPELRNVLHQHSEMVKIEP